jgi:hypothetical protein
MLRPTRLTWDCRIRLLRRSTCFLSQLGPTPSNSAPYFPLASVGPTMITTTTTAGFREKSGLSPPRDPRARGPCRRSKEIRPSGGRGWALTVHEFRAHGVKHALLIILRAERRNRGEMPVEAYMSARARPRYGRGLWRGGAGGKERQKTRPMKIETAP